MEVTFHLPDQYYWTVLNCSSWRDPQEAPDWLSSAPHLRATCPNLCWLGGPCVYCSFLNKDFCNNTTIHGHRNVYRVTRNIDKQLSFNNNWKWLKGLFTRGRISRPPPLILPNTSAEVGKQTFFKSANPKSKNLGLIPLSQIRKLLCLIRKSQICKFQQNTANHCLLAFFLEPSDYRRKKSYFIPLLPPDANKYLAVLIKLRFKILKLLLEECVARESLPLSADAFARTSWTARPR